jgi:repressor LexA
MTPAQRHVFAFILDKIQEQRCPPTCREIADHFGWASCNAAEEKLRWLARHGYIERTRASHRNIRLCGP